MKRLLAVLTIISLAAGAASAQTDVRLKVGPHLGVTLGGDVEEPGLVYGAQAVLQLTDVFSFELSGYMFEDESDDSDLGMDFEIDMEATAVALAMRAGKSFSEDLYAYLSGGIAYYMVDVDTSVDTAGLADVLGVPGLAVDWQADGDVDDEFGFSIGAGLQFNVATQVELFVDFRYVFLELEVEIAQDVTASAPGRPTLSESFVEEAEGDYDHGILRAGANFVF